MYIAVSRKGGIQVFDTFGDAFRYIMESGGGRVYRGELVLALTPDEVIELTGVFGEKAEPVEAPVSRKPVVEKPRVAVVLDQMFRGYYSNILARQYPGIEIHEVIGRGIEKPIRVGNVVKEPARDDYDVLNIVEEIARRGYRVLFFTGDKKLASQAMIIEGVRVYYTPPNEYPGKEALAKYMVEKIREELESIQG